MLPAVALAAYLAALPLYRVTVFSVGGKDVVPADLAFLALIVAATTRGAWRRPAPGPWGVAALPVVATLLAALASGSPAPGAWLEVARVAYSMLTLAVLASLRTGPDALRLAVRTWVVAAIVACAAGILGFVAVVLGAPVNVLAFPNSPQLGAGIVRISGVLDSNALVLYLALAAGFAAFQARFGESHADRRLGAWALVLVSGTVLASVSRGAAGFFVFLALLAWREELAPGWLHRARAAVACLAGGLLAAALAATQWAVTPASVAFDAGPLPSIRWNERPSAYRLLHAAGVRMAASRPLLGIGPGGFALQLDAHTSESERLATWPPLRTRPAAAPHSAWIGAAAEGGLVLLSAWAVLWCWLFAQLWRAGPRPALARVLALALVALILDAFWVDLLHLKFIWAAAGLGLSARVSATDPL